MKRKFFNKRDILIIGLILILAGAIYIFSQYNNSAGEYALVMYDGQVIKKLPLNEDTQYVPDVNKNILIEIKDKKARFVHSDCPDKICVNTGFISKGGQTAVCLPNKLSLIIKSDDDKNIDTVL